MKKNSIQIFLCIFAICLIGCKGLKPEVITCYGPPEPVSGGKPSPTDPQDTSNSNKSSSASSTEPQDTSSQPNSTSTVKTHVIEVTQSLADPKLDILIVIDTSASMERHQQKLGDKLDQLIDHLEGINWQMAFTSTDSAHPVVNADGYNGTFYNLEDANGELTNDNGEKIKILNADSVNLDTIFANTVSREGKSERCDNNNVCEDTGTEAPLLSIVNAIEHQENAGFFRPDATLATIILTNENEFSDGQPIEGFNAEGEAVTINPTTPQDVIYAVTNALGSHKKFVAYGIIIEKDNAQCLASENTNSETEALAYGTFIEDLATAANGITGSICAADYTQILTDFSKHLESESEHFEDQLTLKEVPLEHQPIPNTITMTFTPVANTVDWTWNAQRNVIEFDRPPLAGTTINIEYQYQVTN